MLDGTFSLLSEEGVHPPSPLVGHLLPRSSLQSRGEIQIYAPTAPGVFFELMKNESARPAQFHSPPPPRRFFFFRCAATRQAVSLASEREERVF